MEHIGKIIKTLGNPREMLEKMAKNIPVDAMDNTSKDKECPICGGGGFVHPLREGRVDYSQSIPCACSLRQQKEDRRRRLLKSCKLPPVAEMMTFENFEVYPGVEMAVKESRRMADNPGKLSWLALIGVNGNGKTHLAVSICKAWLSAGIPARYTFVSILLDELREGFQKEAIEERFEARYKYYCNVPLLLLDDYGVESRTPWVRERLDTLLDYRLMNNLSLIVTSNQSMDEMSSTVRSRLIRHSQGRIVAITAGDFALRGKEKR